MQKSEPVTPSPFTQQFNQLNIQSSPSHSMSNLSACSQSLDHITGNRDSIAISESDAIPEQHSNDGSPGKAGDRSRGSSTERPLVAAKPRRSSRQEKIEEPNEPSEVAITSSQDSGIESMGHRGGGGSSFNKMKVMLEKSMGIREKDDDDISEEKETKQSSPPPAQPPPVQKKAKSQIPPPPPRRSSSNALSEGGSTASTPKMEVSPLMQSQQATCTSPVVEETDGSKDPPPPPVPKHSRRSRGEYGPK